jgi:hypothetical protein
VLVEGIVATTPGGGYWVEPALPLALHPMGASRARRISRFAHRPKKSEARRMGTATKAAMLIPTPNTFAISAARP